MADNDFALSWILPWCVRHAGLVHFKVIRLPQGKFMQALNEEKLVSVDIVPFRFIDFFLFFFDLLLPLLYFEISQHGTDCGVSVSEREL